MNIASILENANDNGVDVGPIRIEAARQKAEITDRNADDECRQGESREKSVIRDTASGGRHRCWANTHRVLFNRRSSDGPIRR